MRVHQGDRKRHVVIVGAGPGGLATAMLLAQRGFRVQVFEKQDVIGGRNAELRLGEYRFDLGPTVLMMKFLLDELFVEGGRRSGDYLQFRKLDPMYALSFPDKTMLARSNPEVMKAEIERHFPGEGAASPAFSIARAAALKSSTRACRGLTVRSPAWSVPRCSPPCRTSPQAGHCTEYSAAIFVQRSFASRLHSSRSTSACRRGIVPVSYALTETLGFSCLFLFFVGYFWLIVAVTR
jgi:phytoene dehydrogenase-like protein